MPEKTFVFYFHNITQKYDEVDCVFGFACLIWVTDEVIDRTLNSNV